MFREYGVSQTECKIDRPRPGLSLLSARPHTKALGTRLRSGGDRRSDTWHAQILSYNTHVNCHIADLTSFQLLT
jgi:hypothetical protein